MRQRLVLGAVLAPIASAASAIAFVSACLAFGACGGSSSETPPPLQPDPKGFRYAGVPVSATVAESDAGAQPAVNDPDEDEKPRTPARSTWGSAKPGH
ncbi:MAG: hypothetical protein ABW061_25655 [Polyangiaceae bacterium]